MSDCEHELILIGEDWIGEQSVMVDLECQKCKKRFGGLIIEK